jgi:hypothetical protein
MSGENSADGHDSNEKRDSYGKSQSDANAAARSTGADDSSGYAPPPSGGVPSGRRISLKRIGVIGVGIALVVLVVGVAMAGPSLPSIGLFNECSSDNPTMSVSSFQSSGTNGERVAVQLTQLQGADYVHVVSGESKYGNLTEVGNTATAVGLVQGDSVEYVAFNDCGSQTLGEYTVA